MKTLELLEYSQFLRHKYLETLSGIPWEEAAKDRNASFPSLKDVFVHMIFVTDAYINYGLQGNRNFPNIDYTGYDSIEKIAKYLDDVETRANANLSKMTEEDLAKSEMVLLDFFQEETHHRGELIALFWQMNVEPPHMGFLQFQRKQKQK